MKTLIASMVGLVTTIAWGGAGSVEQITIGGISIEPAAVGKWARQTSKVYTADPQMARSLDARIGQDFSQAVEWMAPTSARDADRQDVQRVLAHMVPVVTGNGVGWTQIRTDDFRSIGLLVIEKGNPPEGSYLTDPIYVMRGLGVKRRTASGTPFRIDLVSVIDQHSSRMLSSRLFGSPRVYADDLVDEGLIGVNAPAGELSEAIRAAEEDVRNEVRSGYSIGFDPNNQTPPPPDPEVRVVLDAGVVGAPGSEEIRWTIDVETFNVGGLGLAGIVLDLRQDAFNPELVPFVPADSVPATFQNFALPAGIANPSGGGFRGTVIAEQPGLTKLAEIGGLQNTSGEVLGVAIGTSTTVDTTVSVGSLTRLAEGSVPVPATPGVYRLFISDVEAVVIAAIDGPSGSAFSLSAELAIDSVLEAIVEIVGPMPCSIADLVEPFGTLDLADITAFVSAFSAAEPAGDLNSDGIFDLADITLFVSTFEAGCPGGLPPEIDVPDDLFGGGRYGDRRIRAMPCNGADLAEPYGIHSFNDLRYFLRMFDACDPAIASLGGDPRDCDDEDIRVFTSLFAMGCR
jgi:hypothetical protein